MPYPELSYDQLNTRLVDQKELTIETSDGKYMVRKSGIFFAITNFEKDAPPCEDGKKIKKHGLKFHVSLPEYDRTQFGKGWDIVKDSLIEHGVKGFKVVQDNEKISDTPSQRGKDITIYCDLNLEKTITQWNEVVQEITQKLVEHGIAPGYRPLSEGDRADTPVKGSNYVSYRYENKQPSYDMCAGMQVLVDNQLPNYPWQPMQGDNIINQSSLKTA